jgi:hypothetical protein
MAPTTFLENGKRNNGGDAIGGTRKRDLVVGRGDLRVPNFPIRNICAVGNPLRYYSKPPVKKAQTAATYRRIRATLEVRGMGLFDSKVETRSRVSVTNSDPAHKKKKVQPCIPTILVDISTKRGKHRARVLSDRGIHEFGVTIMQ